METASEFEEGNTHPTPDYYLAKEQVSRRDRASASSLAEKPSVDGPKTFSSLLSR